jgi:Ca-activated chloride channel family protein
MKRIRYSKYVPDPAGEMSMEDLLGALSDYLLQSGFQNYLYDDFGDGEHTLDDLRQAIEQALLNSDLLDEQMRERVQQNRRSAATSEV